MFLFENRDLKKLKEETKDRKLLINGLQDHFLPHIRGLFAGVKGNNFFWYPVIFDTLSFEPQSGDMQRKYKYEEAQAALKKLKMDFLGFYRMPYSNRRTYREVWQELSEKNFVSMDPKWPDFDFLEVSVDELLDRNNQDKNLFVFYPMRFPNLKETMPLVITNQTHKASNNKSPVVLGIYAENKAPGYGFKGGILRIKDPKAAQYISNQITKELETSVDVVLFTPRKGRPKYDRIYPNL